MAPAEMQSGFRSTAENASTVTSENFHLFVMKAAHTTCSGRGFVIQEKASDLSSVCLSSSKDWALQEHRSSLCLAPNATLRNEVISQFSPLWPGRLLSFAWSGFRSHVLKLVAEPHQTSRSFWFPKARHSAAAEGGVKTPSCHWNPCSLPSGYKGKCNK